MIQYRLEQAPIDAYGQEQELATENARLKRQQVERDEELTTRGNQALYLLNR